ncbi:hypothetical protein [Actinomadura keratinilytica]
MPRLLASSARRMLDCDGEVFMLVGRPGCTGGGGGGPACQPSS